MSLDNSLVGVTLRSNMPCDGALTTCEATEFELTCSVLLRFSSYLLIILYTKIFVDSSLLVFVSSPMIIFVLSLDALRVAAFGVRAATHAHMNASVEAHVSS